MITTLNKHNNPNPTHNLRHGINEVLFPISDKKRQDRYHSNNGYSVLEERFSQGIEDISGPVTTYDRESPYYRQYNPDCSCCYLNNSHTTDRHDASIKPG